ncbi:MAG: AraC family transcriptional regulator [Tissierellia bacterium]|nr:AraC family transcriptional regulator [Tissierellia bacterium]
MDSKEGNNLEIANNNCCTHFILNSKNGDILHFKGNRHNIIGDSVLYRIMDGIYMFKTKAIYKDTDLKGVYSYPDDALVIYKVKKGKISAITEDNKEVKLNCGDILNASSNFKMSKFHSFNKEVEYIGVIYFYKAMMEAVRNQSLNEFFLEEFYHSPVLHNIFIHKGNYRINKLFDEIDNFINLDNKILMKAKSLELLSESAIFHGDFIDTYCKDLSEEKIKLLKEIKGFLDNNLDKYYSMEFISNKFSISLSGLKNLFTEAYGISPYIYHLNRRLDKAALLLEESDYKINYIYKAVGFNYHSNFSNAFQKKYKCTPSEYRERENKI